MPAGGASHMVMLLNLNFQTIPVFILIFSVILWKRIDMSHLYDQKAA